MTCFLESVHTDESSRHWSDFEYTSLHGALIGPPIDGYLAFLLDLFPPAYVHVSPRRDYGVSSTLKCGILFFLVTHSTAPRSETASSLTHLSVPDLSNSPLL